MRRIVYMELARNFRTVDAVVRPHVKDDGTLILTGNRWRMLKTFATYDGETYMKEHPPTFYQLKEGEVLTTIYYWFHRIDGNPKYADSEILAVQRKSDDGEAGAADCPIYGLSEMKAPLGWFSDCYRQYPFLKKQLKKFVTAADFKHIDSATALYRHSSTFEELADAGIIRIVRKEEARTTPPEPPPAEVP